MHTCTVRDHVWIGLLFSGLVFGATCALPTPAEAQAPSATNTADRLAWFQDARFGMFIHWGLYAQPAGEWKGRDRAVSGHGSGSYGEWIQLEAKIPCAEYDQLAGTFNPTKFDARTWVRLAKEAGMKYIVITAKHHDGFSMFDSKLTDFNIVKATPFRRDPLKELAEACRAEGIRFCVYYSIVDWHHPELSSKYCQQGFHGQPKADADLDKYVAYMKGQVRELLTNYGPIGIVWFDGGGSFKNVDRENLLHAREIIDMIREVQPACLANNRLGFGDYGTPEQFIPGEKGTNAFEVCMTLNRHWGYNRKDQDWKPAEQVIRNLVDIASKNGNYLLNVGPTELGEIPGPSVERLKAIGAWMKINGEAIYGTGPTPFGIEIGRASETQKDSRGKPVIVDDLDWRCTTKPGKLYVHLLKWPGTTFKLPAVASPITRAYLLADPERKAVPFEQTKDGVTFTLPATAPAPVIPVLCVETKETR